jgi:hypothetical protein
MVVDLFIYCQHQVLHKWTSARQIYTYRWHLVLRFSSCLLFTTNSQMNFMWRVYKWHYEWWAPLPSSVRKTCPSLVRLCSVVVTNLVRCSYAIEEAAFSVHFPSTREENMESVKRGDQGQWKFFQIHSYKCKMWCALPSVPHKYLKK